MAQDSPKIDRSVLIESAVNDALKNEGRHWDLVHSELKGTRPDTEIPSRSWEQFPKLSVSFGERLFSREAIMEHNKSGWFAMQIAMDLIWISGFTLVGSRIEHGLDLIAPYIQRCLTRADTDTSRFDAEMLASHNQWSYCAREIIAQNDPSPHYFAVAAESTLSIAALVLDLGLEQNLFFDAAEADSDI